MHGEHADTLAIEAVGDAGLAADKHRLGERLRRCPGAGQHADLDDVAGSRPARRWTDRRGALRQNPDVATPPSLTSMRSTDVVPPGSAISIAQRCRPIDGADPTVAADDDGDGGGSVGHRVGGDEVGGEALADPAGIDAGSLGRAGRPSPSASMATCSIHGVRSASRAAHRRVVGTAGHDRRFGHRLQQRHRRPAAPRSEHRRPRSAATRRCPGRNGLQHASSRAIRIIASSASRSQSAPSPSTTTVDRQPIARKRAGRALTAIAPTRRRRGRAVAAPARAAADGDGRRGAEPGPEPEPGRSSSPAGRASSSAPRRRSWSGDGGRRRQRRRRLCRDDAPARRSVAPPSPSRPARPNTNIPVAPAVAILASWAGGALRPGGLSHRRTPVRCCRRRHHRHSPLSDPPPPAAVAAARPAVVVPSPPLPARRCCRRRCPATPGRRRARGWLRSGPRPTSDSSLISTLAAVGLGAVDRPPGDRRHRDDRELATGRVEQGRAGVAPADTSLASCRRGGASSRPTTAWQPCSSAHAVVGVAVRCRGRHRRRRRRHGRASCVGRRRGRRVRSSS